ncbi:hypothetical protein GGI03_007688 [Coemansia sp. RSA 2337]|nr:hypothetical protein LPJ71_006173 [Coemansia sp. S17]KAJ2020325.1 hypothetical protein GGI14_000912 [Coemansia sp. S680]KAJ2027361.1 hypothetical protein H4S03_008287 [Coemansia sp. S3946]KAJ2041178.1 hypothetical protein H4S04_007738 [Coemansia sp. S16]KAJ2053794.1 hypothetical protein GGI08_004737 [Coemansia sp. S2]KAJ2059849.1 hypothetical protein GGH13_006876 [Coemansia sp. S155-1]KAJ2087370.1 hypothetical protein GGI16_006473 [Coemansia sp. S142-1]KAJ2102865.1 hypothetical protein GG
MSKVKKILVWCAKHTPCIPQRRPSRLFRRRAETLDESVYIPSQQLVDERSVSTETLVDEKHRARALSDPPISEYQHVYSYYPWSESEHDAILSRSPPPLRRPHYETFPSLVEMGGFLSL